MYRVTLQVLIAVVALSVLCPASASAQYDDRTLLWARGARPNVLLILDSGATMVHDPETDTQNFLANGDDPGSKLYQAKEVIGDFIETNSYFNMGFSYYEKSSISVAYLNYIYRVVEMVDTDNDGVAESEQQAMLDGTPPLAELRLGSSEDVHAANVNKVADPIFPIRYGYHGDEEYLVYVAGNDGTPERPRNGDLRVRSYLVDADGNRKVAGQAPFYYPAYDWGSDVEATGLSVDSGVKSAMLGQTTWATVAATYGFDLTDIEQREQFRAYVLEDITKRGDPWGQELGALEQSNQIGSRVLHVHEELEVYRNATKEWVADGATRTTELEWVRQFVLYDHPPGTSTLSGAPTLSSVSWQGEATCQGYLDLPNTAKAPIIPIPTDENPNNRELIASYFDEQVTPIFYFPTRGDTHYLPTVREHYIPMTEVVMAGGRRPIKDTLNEAAHYFTQDILKRDDELAGCRLSFVILVSDGIETCVNQQKTPCVAAENLGKQGIKVHVVGFGPEQLNLDNSLSCVATDSGGVFYPASNAQELASALRRIGLEIERDTRGFSSPVVPSVQASTDQVAYIASFIPSDNRSIWHGQLHAYEINAQDGTLPVDEFGRPDTSAALWEAGEELVTTRPVDRSMYFGGDSGAGVAIPGARHSFATSNDETAMDRIRGLINPSLTDTGLTETVNFMRGDREQLVYQGSKLGAVFHSRPQVVNAPSCYPCYLSNLHDYRSAFRSVHHKRRAVLYFGANDGALHAVDAGFWDTNTSRYDTGSGKELFSWVPRSTMPVFDDLAFGLEHQWTVDGTPTLADVWIDPAIAADEAPNSDQREWRSVALFGQRRGGNSIVCLDITQPDTYTDGVPIAGQNRAPSCAGGGNGCSATWPAFRWEFTDTSDEDANLRPDLGQTWSRPLVGFIRVQIGVGEGATTDERSVAIFGGGYHPSRPTGNFLYIVDIETGKILFKQNVVGMVPGQVAALDVNLDGFLERLYWGTTDGEIWRMEVDSYGVLGDDGRIGNWNPQILLDAGSAQPFFMQPRVIPVTFDAAGEVVVALAIGSGNRDNIFYRNETLNRFYMVLDRGNGVQLTEANLQPVTVASDPTTSNYVHDPNLSGWYLLLGEEEKVNTNALVINEKVIFSTFTPGVVQIDEESRCYIRGNAKTYVVSLYNANPIASDGDRFDQHESAVIATDPVMYVGADGRMHILQSLDNLQLFEPIAAWSIPLRVFSWKED